MAEISANLARALARGDSPLLLFYCDHPTVTVRAHTRTGIIRWGGFDWVGFGKLGRISGATRSVNLAVNEVTFEVRGVPPTSEEMLSGQVRGRSAKVWRAAISKRGRLTVDDDPTIDARLDNQKLSVDPASGNATIKLIGEQGPFDLDRAVDLAFSDQQQRAEYPNDCGCALLHTFQNRESKWRAA